MKKILVTGSNGFIGRALVKKLCGLGYDIIGFDIIDGDLTEEGSLRPIEKEEIYYVFHLAGKTFIPESWTSPLGFYLTNVIGTANVLEFCRKTGAELTFVSSYPYGSPEYLPIDENHPVKAYNPYSHTKLMAEDLCRFYIEQFKIGISVIRPFNVYGPGQSEKFLIPELIRKMTDPEIDIVEVLNLKPKRDFVYLDDFVEALCLSMDGPRGIYNVGSGSSISVEDILHEIRIVTGKDKPLRNLGIERLNEIFDLYADVSRISRELKWKPVTGIHEGIEKCVNTNPNL